MGVRSHSVLGIHIPRRPMLAPMLASKGLSGDILNIDSKVPTLSSFKPSSSVNWILRSRLPFFRNMDSFDHPDDEVRIFAELRSLISDRLRGLDQATFTSLYDQLEEQLSTLRVRNGLRKYQASQGAYSVTIAQLILDRSCLWTTRIKWKGDGTTTLVI